MDRRCIAPVLAGWRRGSSWVEKGLKLGGEGPCEDSWLGPVAPDSLNTWRRSLPTALSAGSRRSGHRVHAPVVFPLEEP